jgi:hypothetical protein
MVTKRIGYYDMLHRISMTACRVRHRRRFANRQPSEATAAYRYDANMPTRPTIKGLSLIVWSFANHGIDCMHWALHLFPNRLVHQLLSLHRTFAFELGRNHNDRNVRSIWIIECACDDTIEPDLSQQS